MPDSAVPEPIDLDAITPKLSITVGGVVRSYDIYELWAKIRNLDLDASESGGEVDGKPVPSFEQNMDRVRAAFGLPTLDSPGVASGEVKVISTGTAFKLAIAVAQAIKEDGAAVKNALGPTPS